MTSKESGGIKWFVSTVGIVLALQTGALIWNLATINARMNYAEEELRDQNGRLNYLERHNSTGLNDGTEKA